MTSTCMHTVHVPNEMTPHLLFLQRDVSEIRSTTLTQFLLNWTLSELADMYRPPSTPVVPERPKFDVMNVEDWYRQVVMPILRRFLPNEEALMHRNITHAFHQVLYVRLTFLISYHSFVFIYVMFLFSECQQRRA